MLCPECLNFYSEHFSFWDKLNDNEKQLLCDNTQKANYKKGQNIHGGNDECSGVTFVKKGCLRVYMLSEEGKEITLYRLFQGDICVLSASCVLQAITFDVLVDAEEDSDVFLIKPSAFNSLVESNIYVENFTYKLATTRFSDVMWAMQQILFMSFDKRLAIFLNDEISKSGTDTINLTHEQIAKYIGSAREVVSRMLKHFSSEKVVEVSRGGIKIIDKNKLHALCR